MSAIANFALPAYVGVEPVRHRQVVFGLEDPFSAWDDLQSLAREEWEHYKGKLRQTGFHPDYTAYAQMAEAGRMAAVTVRQIRTGVLAGYFIGRVGPLLSEVGTLLLYELALYLRSDVRKHRTFTFFIDYVEHVARHFDCDGIVLTHLSSDPAIGRLFSQHGYGRMTCAYMKRLDHGPP